MSAVAKTFITPEEYLERERAAEFKSEYLRGEMFAMAGATWEHCVITSNLILMIAAGLRGRSCRVNGSDLRVAVSTTGLYTYPDVSIACGEPRFEDNRSDTLLNPIAIVEVLSASTEQYDRGQKFKHYQRILSLREYILVSQEEMRIERFVRENDSRWSYAEFSDPAIPFELVSVQLNIAMPEIYRDVTFPDAPLR